jgi:hypothetical protein
LASSLAGDVDKVAAGARVAIFKPKVVGERSTLARNTLRFARGNLRRTRLAKKADRLPSGVCKGSSDAAGTRAVTLEIGRLAFGTSLTQRRASAALKVTLGAVNTGSLTSDVDLRPSKAGQASLKTKFV